MPINFSCPHCKNQILVADEFAGKTGPCVNCEQAITIPGAIQTPQPEMGNVYSAPMQPSVPQVPYQAPEQQKQSDLGMRVLLPVDRSALAIIAGYVGLFSVLVCPAPIAVILGILAIVDIKKNPTKHGLGRAWFAIIMGVVCMIAGASVFILLP